MFKNMLRGAFALTALTFASQAALDDTYLTSLTTSPFNKLTTGVTFSDESTVYDRPVMQLYNTDYKRDILLTLFENATTRVHTEGDPVNCLEIGTGSGFMTGEFAHRAYNEFLLGNTVFDNVAIHTIDDWRTRATQTVRGSLALEIPQRGDFDTIVVPGTNAEGEYYQMLSYLVHKESVEGLAPDALLGRIKIGRKTAELSGSFGRTDSAHITNPIPGDFFTAGITGTTSNLDEVMLEMNGALTNKYGTIFIDTDPGSQAEMYDTLRAAWNALAPWGALIIDDYNWTFSEAGGDAYVGQGVLQFLNTHQTEINANYLGAVDFSSDDHAVVYDYDGQDSGTPDNITVGLSKLDTGRAEPIVEFHNIWPGRGRWITVIRRDDVRSTDIDLTV